ncbi:MAG TPA: hypothetical protein VH593_06100 [Ktedonobacteraceae bacterium]|jgi:hypothetical protein
MNEEEAVKSWSDHRMMRPQNEDQSANYTGTGTFLLLVTLCFGGAIAVCAVLGVAISRGLIH